MSHRPMDNIESLRSWWVPVYIATAFVDTMGSNEVKMMHSSECSKCSVSGWAMDIMRHERLDHGIYFPFGMLQNAADVRRNAPSGLVSLADLQVPNELLDIVATAESTYIGATQYSDYIDGEDVVKQVELFDLKFPGKECKIAVDYYIHGICGERGIRLGEGSFVVWCQLLPDTAPVELLFLGMMQTSKQVYEADSPTFRMLTDAMGLYHTSPAQLLAVLLSHVMEPSEFGHQVLGLNSCRSEQDFCDIRILHEAYEIWAAAADNDESGDGEEC